MFSTRRNFVSMRDFLEDLEVRSNMSSVQSETVVRPWKQKEKSKLSEMFRTEAYTDNRHYNSLVQTSVE